jgi:hypothetical protein
MAVDGFGTRFGANVPNHEIRQFNDDIHRSDRQYFDC